MRAFLLAAGRGRRAGGPKAWLPCEGVPLLERQLSFLLGRFEPGRVAVSIQAAWLPRCLALAPGVAWVPADPDGEAGDSLAALLRAVPCDDWAFLHHVDMPVWEPGLFDLLGARARGGAEAVLPTFGGRGGHPVLLSPAAQRALRAAPSPRLDHWLRGRRVRTVEVPYACCRENWNGGPAAKVHA